MQEREGCEEREEREALREIIKQAIKELSTAPDQSRAELNDRIEAFVESAGAALAAREDTERPDGSSVYEFDDQGHAVPSDDSHWATVVIDPENFEPRELTEAVSVELDESGLGIAVERMWIRPGVRDTEQEQKDERRTR